MFSPKLRFLGGSLEGVGGEEGGGVGEAPAEDALLLALLGRRVVRAAGVLDAILLEPVVRAALLVGAHCSAGEGCSEGKIMNKGDR